MNKISLDPVCTINISGYSLDNYKTFNPEGYTILCHIGQASDGLSYFPETSKLILDNRQQSILLNNFDKVIPNIAEDFGITQQAAVEKSLDFFSNTQITVEPIGFQGKFYKLMKNAQNFIPMVYTTEAVSVSKTTGMTGFQIINSAPLTFVGATYIGALFFGYCGSVAGNNAVGTLFNSTSFLLSRPMRGVEITLNGLLLRPLSNRIGIPLVLNGTQEMLRGKGLSVDEYAKIGLAFERINNSRIVQKTKRILEIIREKGD